MCPGTTGCARYCGPVTFIGVDRLVLVRHAMPVLEPEVPAERWHLGSGGKAAARSLRAALPQAAYYVSSDEPKAAETIREIAGDLDVALDPDFGEVRRPHVWAGDADHRAVNAAYLDGACHDGWEAPVRVVERFGAAVARHAAAARGRPLIIGTHGMAPTLWLADRMRLAPNIVEFWQALRYPDLIAVDLAAGQASRIGAGV